MLLVGFLVKGQSNNTPKISYGESTNSDSTTTNKQKPVLAKQDSSSMTNQNKKVNNKFEIKLSEKNIINNSDSILIKKKEIEN